MPFDTFDTNDSYCILCWVRDVIDPLASWQGGRIRAKGRTFKALKGIERAFKVRYA